MTTMQKVTGTGQEIRGHVGHNREIILALVLVVLVVIMSSLSPLFLTASNLLDMSRYFAETGLIALGMTLIIITGGIDLSVGSILALSSVTLGFSYQAGMPLPLSVLCAVVVGILCGLLNGVLTTAWNIHPLAITIATMALFRGIANAVSNQRAVSSFPEWFGLFGQGAVGLVPNQLIVLAVAVVIAAIILHRSRFGREVYAIGLNPVVARFSGIKVRRDLIAVYALTGMLAGIAAVIYTSRVSSARSDAGLALELSVIAAVVLGGASVRGGIGSIIGTVLGLLIISTLNQGLLLTSLNANWVMVILGAVMLVGVFINEGLRPAPR
ncbi:ABC transporter permease [Rhodococcus opacus]|uniref:ABC transporter permease n=1 Tax=Rhodococcus opacus TaxID=37919 RepID=UPI001C45ABFB|nr:ABC transporter permease [Rhodococcus opacus]MBV6760249.1 ABC transporter permease [Rhodococcus opacus]